MSTNQYRFVHQFFGIQKPMTHKRRRHWIRQQRRLPNWQHLEPITTISNDFF